MEKLKLIVLLFVVLTTVEGSLKQKELYEKLLKDYNPLFRPVWNDSDAVNVKIGMTLMRIVNVDILKSLIELTAWLNFAWDDAHLVWDPAEFNYIMEIKIPADKMWKPDIYAYNQVGENFGPFHDQMWVIVSHDGSCSYFPPVHLTTSCKMAVNKYPYDRQDCEVKFGSWVHNGYELDLHPIQDEGDLSDLLKSEEWNVLGLPAKRNIPFFLIEPYVDVTYTLKLQRRGDLIYSAIRSTNWVIFGLIFMSVLLVPSSFFKLGLSVLTMSLTAYASIIFNPTSEKHYSTDIAGYFFNLFFVTFSVLFTNVLVYHFFFKLGSAPNLVKKALDNCPITRPKLENYIDLQELTSRAQSHSSPHVVGDWKYLAIILDKFFFYFWICFIFSFYPFAFPSFDVDSPPAD